LFGVVEPLIRSNSPVSVGGDGMPTPRAERCQAFTSVQR